MKRLAAWAVTIAVGLAMPIAAQTNNNPVVLTVNDEPVYWWEVGLIIPQLRSDAAAVGVEAKREDLINAALRRVVESRLLAQEARRRGLAPDDARVDQALAQFEARSGGPEGFKTALENIGATSEQVRAHVAESDLVQIFIDTQIEPRVSLTDREVETFYNENLEEFARPDMVRVRHILIRVTPVSTEEEKVAARAKAVAARRRIVEGADFASVASEVSEGREAVNGGDMGFITRETVMPELANVAFALKVGEISEIIETRFGFHILKVEEKRAASTMTFAEAEESARRMLTNSRVGELVEQLLRQLRGSADIVMVAPPGGTPSPTDGG